MDTSTQKIVAIVLMVIGVIIALSGLVAIISVYNAKAELAQLSSMVGSEGMAMARAMGARDPSYVGALITFLIGVGGVVGGVFMHSKASQKEKALAVPA